MKKKQTNFIALAVLIVILVVAVVGGVLGWHFSSSSNNRIDNNSDENKSTREKEESLFQLEYNTSLSGMNGNLEIYSATDSDNDSNSTKVYHISVEVDNDYAEGIDNVDLCFTNDSPPEVNTQWWSEDHPSAVCVYGVNHLTVFPHGLLNKVDVSKYQCAVFVERTEGTTLGAGRYQIAKDVDSATNTDPDAADTIAATKFNSPWTMTNLIEATDDYKISGGIYFKSRFKTAKNGTSVEIPYLDFKDIYLEPVPPGLWLYISKDSDWVRLWANDVIVTIDDVESDDNFIQLGSFSKQGSHSQDFDVDINITDYVGGVWKIWCDNFQIGLAGGKIEEIPSPA